MNVIIIVLVPETGNPSASSPVNFYPVKRIIRVRMSYKINVISHISKQFVGIPPLF